MKIIPKLTAGLMALGLTLGAARADSFNFSYVFGDGLAVTGSLDGTQNGLFVENVTNVSVSFDGIAMAGPIFTAHYDGGSYLNGLVISFDALQNNFFFADTDLVAGDFGYGSLFYMVNASVFADIAVADSPLLGLASLDDPTASRNWSLTRVTVPEQGATIALFAAGLILVFWCRARLLPARACAVDSVRG